MTFVKTKLLIERMAPGDRCTVRLKGVEPLTNVPRSVTELGHVIEALEKENGEPDEGVHRLVVRKV